VFFVCSPYQYVVVIANQRIQNSDVGGADVVYNDAKNMFYSMFYSIYIPHINVCAYAKYNWHPISKIWIVVD